MVTKHFLRTATFVLCAHLPAAAQPAYVGGIMGGGFTPLQIELTDRAAGKAFYRPLIRDGYPLRRLLLNADSFVFEWEDDDGPAVARGAVRGEVLRGEFRQGGFQAPLELIAGVLIDSALEASVTGLYARADGQIVWIGAVSEFSRHLGFVNVTTGRAGMLYQRGNREFVSGPTSFATSPTAITISLRPDDNSYREDGVVQALTRLQTYRTETVTFSNRDAELSGTLVLPQRAGRHPAVVLMHGAGPARRSYFSALPYVLAHAGIATLVYDKRGVGASSGKRFEASMATFADDARAGAAMLRSRSDIRAHEIGVYGHSQGGWQAPLAAVRGDEFKFVIMSAGPAKNYAEQTIDEISASMRAAGHSATDIARARAHQRLYWRVVQRQASWRELERSVSAVSKLPWARFVWKPKNFAEIRRDTLDVIEPSVIIPKLRVPTLALYAQNDFRVNTTANAPIMQRLLAQARTSDATVLVFPRADHDFFEAKEPTIRDVLNTTGYVSGYVQTMLSWILRRVTVQPEN